MGGKEKNFHIGGVRKLAEVFAKFYLFSIKENKNSIIQDLKQLQS